MPDPRPFTVSVVSHGQGAYCELLIQDLARQAAGSVAQLILTLNIPENRPAMAGLPFPVVVIENPKPLGFGANHNQAFARSTSAHFAVLNPDLRLVGDPFPALLACLADPAVGIVAPLVCEADGSVADFARPLVTPSAVLRRRLPRTAAAALPTHPEWIAGMFLALRREVYADLCGFDEHYFLYCEDVDLCARARLRGLRLEIATEVKVQHLAQRASRRSLPRMRQHLASLLRLWTSPVYRKYRALLRAQARS